MSKLNFIQKTIFEVDYGDLDDFLSIEYSHPFEFVADRECSNDSQHFFHVDGNMSEYDMLSIERYRRNGEGFYITSLLLNDCCLRGLIPPGDYLIRVCW